MRFHFFVLIVSLILFISACTPIKPKATDITATNQERRAQEIALLDQWTLNGRTIITQDKEAWHVSMHWQENEGVYQIKLLGPFAQGGLILDVDNQQSTLTMSNGQILKANNPEALLAKATGVLLPVSALRDWVRGLPYHQAKIDTAEYDDKNRLVYLEQASWKIEFLKYIPFKQYSMPAKIFIKHDNLSIKIIILDWDTL